MITPYDTFNAGASSAAVVAFGSVAAGSAPVTLGTFNPATTGQLFVVLYGRFSTAVALLIERSTDSGTTWTVVYTPTVSDHDPEFLRRRFVVSPIAPAGATGSALYRLSVTTAAPGAAIDFAVYQ